MVVCIAIFASCTKNPAKVLPKKDGKWNYTSTSTNSKGQTETSTGTIVFTESGFTMTDSSNGSFALTGTWSYSKSSEEITLTITLFGTTDSAVYKVSDMTRKSETWTNTKDATDVLKLTKAD